ncbi:RNA-binding protein NOB1 isoform X1 [Hippocampus zosterae]|uniref:RNA-binding protein NOB1 isoform X1 n=1 Tax=Hippocampus zosterae TaxID=109293 RepID=UPI00223E5093|nr:RNA-binding protein NOB1 isoform X1 [Hippocampus zosterae]
MAQPGVEHVVADAGAFLNKAPLQDIGKTVYTPREVVDEIRDKATRKSLAFLPYRLNLQQPAARHVRFVTEFSKKTGDYPSLSSTDIKVLALTLQLEEEHVGTGHLRKEPRCQVDVSDTRRHPETPVNVAGFHFPSEVCKREVRSTPQPPASPPGTDAGEFNSFLFWRQTPAPVDRHLLALLEDDGTQEVVGKDDEEEEEEDDDVDDDDDGGGWITPSNIGQMKIESSDWTTAARVKVGCLTTDFAMQNVLIQMGLHVVSLNGMLIKQARNYILRCHACFTTTSDMSKQFCPKCGNRTLKKVSVSVDEDGRVRMHFSSNPKVLNARGLRYSLPLPRGGKHSRNPHVCEDQRFPQQRLSRKARQKTDAWDPDYAAGGASPFCQNDVYSRAANLKLRDADCGAGRRRVNPNAARGKYNK